MNIAVFLTVFVLLVHTVRMQETQCMQGFLEEDTLRSKATLIGRTITRQHDQVVIPGIKFTCTGTLTGWRFVAERHSGRGRNDYPELQVWRPQPTSPGSYNIVRSVRISSLTTSQGNVFLFNLTNSISYQAGDVLGIYHTSSGSSVYKILSVQHGGPNNYYTTQRGGSSETFNTQSSSVRIRTDYPLVGGITSNPECLSGFLSDSELNARGRNLGASSQYQALSNQQRLITSMTYGCSGEIGRIIVAAQNKGTGGARNSYPQIQMMRRSTPASYLKYDTFSLNQPSDVRNPNVFEFTPTSTLLVRPGDVIRLYQPQSSDSVYEVYHEPGVGPTNYYINGFSSVDWNLFLIGRSMQDNSQPLFIVELIARCPTLEDPSNGEVQTTGSVAVYECNSGYKLVGQRQRTCDNNTAQWLGTAPQCAVIDCGPLAQVPNGQVRLSSGTGLGAIASYSCLPQYSLAGSSTRECLATSQWSGQQPICRRQCSPLTSTSNGHVSSPSQPLHGDTASFSCSINYELAGAVIVTCQSNGQWSPSPPSCQLIQCPELTNPTNGLVEISPVDRTLRSIANFQCINGYQLRGQSRLLCQQNKQWSSQPPTCQRVQCQSVSRPANGEVTVSGREAVFTCNEGYRIVGFTTITCQPNGIWSSQPPTCRSIQCPPLFNPSNGRVEYNNRTVGSSAEYYCYQGYLLVGTATTVCQLSTQNWSHPPPTCNLVDCGPPPPPQYGFVNLQSQRTFLDDYAIYFCGTGYRLVGREQRVCQQNGLWSGELPGCLAAGCGAAPEVANSETSTNGSRYNDVANYSCETGYRKTGGDLQLVCGYPGEWEGTPPSCSAVTCGELLPPVNGDVHRESTDFNSTASYTCHKGYILSGVSQSVCLADGHWSGSTPLCLPLSNSTATITADKGEPVPTTTVGSGDEQPPKNARDSMFLPQPASPLLDLPTTSTPRTTKRSNSANAYIIWGMMVVLVFLIVLVVVLIVVVYIKKHKINHLDTTVNNSVENPVYSGHGGTPLETINCFRPTSEAMPSSLSGQEVHSFSFQSASGSEEETREGFSEPNGVHLYDFPSLSTCHRNTNGSYSGPQSNGTAAGGHSYEFPDHYHLATQYEVPVSSSDKRSQPRARLHIYNNSLPADIYVPTLEQREKPAIDKEVSCRSNNSTVTTPSAAEENLFFSDTETYWRPASDPAGLYEQLARNKYREINRTHTQVTELLGAGQFGKVNRGVWESPAGEKKEVAIKTLRQGVTEEDKVRFLQEAAISGQFQHPNVVRLHGVVTVGEPIMMVLELLPNGDLRNYLIKQRPGVGQNMDNSWPKQLLHFCRDISCGMTYLSSKAFVHRDLAARNILVAKDTTCKPHLATTACPLSSDKFGGWIATQIGDFGLSRDLDEENYYISNGGKIPVKWTAPEALHYKKYSTASDVWSFGCLMYEIWSLGHKPFEKTSNAEAMKMGDHGFRLPPPPGCPRAIYQLMIQCWHPQTSSRPAFPVLLHALSRDSRRLLSWSKGDSDAHPQASVLGAPLEAGLDLYVDLQRTYIISNLSSSP